MSDQAELHNKLASDIVRQMVTPIMESGGDVTDLLVLAESVLTGVALASVKFGVSVSAFEVMDTLADGARDRLEAIAKKGRINGR